MNKKYKIIGILISVSTFLVVGILLVYKWVGNQIMKITIENLDAEQQ